MGHGNDNTVVIRQQTLADLLGCSRRSIYRALKQLKEQGYLAETKKRQIINHSYQKAMGTHMNTRTPSMPM